MGAEREPTEDVKTRTAPSLQEIRLAAMQEDRIERRARKRRRVRVGYAAAAAASTFWVMAMVSLYMERPWQEIAAFVGMAALVLVLYIG
jgi:hypothetical protein